MTDQTRPVIVQLNCEANPSTNTEEIDRAEWDAMTPAERGAMLDEMVNTHMSNSGGGGWYIADTDDEASVGFSAATRVVDVDAVMKLVTAYGAECGRGGSLEGRALGLLDTIREAITGKEV